MNSQELIKKSKPLVLFRNGIAICMLFICVFTFGQVKNERIVAKSLSEFSNSLFASVKGIDSHATKTSLTIKI